VSAVKKSSANRLTLVSVMVVISLCLGRPLRSGVTGQNLVFTVLAYDYAHLPHETITQAEMEGTRIFRKAGVDTIWLNCSPATAEAGEPAVCQKPLGPLDFVLRIVPTSKAGHATLDHSTLAFAVLEGDNRAYVTVLYEPIAELAANHDVPASQLLGHAVAHEIGHLFLGANAHSPRGLMRARWDEKDVQLAAQRNLLFTQPQSELIRAKIFAARPQARRAQDLPPVSAVH
jgi:hypothetical protein